MATDSRFDIVLRNNEVINLSKETCQKYLTNNQVITDSEFNMFFQLCKTHKVNPFLKEAYIVKYGSEPATIVLDYKVLQQVAEDNPSFVGLETGVLVVDKDGNEKERKGAYVLPSETLVAGWCEVLRNDRKVSTKVYAMFDEFKQTKKDGTLNKNWAGKPVFMIVKVAKAQALREAFPNMFGSNVYSSEEAEIIENERKNQETKFENTNEVQENIVDVVATEKVENDLDDFTLFGDGE